MNKNPNLTLGQLIDKLSDFCGSSKIVIKEDNDLYTPTDVYSYRGYYKDLAICYEKIDDNRYTTVSKLINMLENCSGKTFTGYHGGDYYMTNSTNMWCSNYGCASGLKIIDVEKLSDKVVIITQYR